MLILWAVAVVLCGFDATVYLNLKMYYDRLGIVHECNTYIRALSLMF